MSEFARWKVYWLNDLDARRRDAVSDPSTMLYKVHDIPLVDASYKFTMADPKAALAELRHGSMDDVSCFEQKMDRVEHGPPQMEEWVNARATKWSRMPTGRGNNGSEPKKPTFAPGLMPGGGSITCASSSVSLILHGHALPGGIQPTGKAVAES